jgi:hypothetical protein
MHLIDGSRDRFANKLVRGRRNHGPNLDNRGPLRRSVLNTVQ